MILAGKEGLMRRKGYEEIYWGYAFIDIQFNRYRGAVIAACPNCGKETIYKQCTRKFSSVSTDVTCSATIGCYKHNEYYQTESRCYTCLKVTAAAQHLERIDHKLCKDQIRCPY